MALPAIVAMFSGAARASAKGFQGLLTGISPVARAATSGSARLLSKLSPAARNTFQAISKSIRPVLVKGLKYSKNVGHQSVSVLQKKARASRHVLRRSRRFWTFGKRRMNEISRELVKLQRAKTSNPQQAAILGDEMKTLQGEQSAFEHLEADEKSITDEFKKARQHDFRPLLKKSNHAAKMIAIEDRKGAIDPNVLEEYLTSEESLLRRIGEEEGFERKVGEDEFKMMKLLISALTKEGSDLKEQLRLNSQDRFKRITERRLKRVLSELYMLQHALHLAENEVLDEEILRKKALKIYQIMEWLKKVEAKENFE